MPKWEKGKSGNPSGRAKVAEEFRARCRKAVDEHCLAAWIDEVVTRGVHWAKCSEFLANYAYGKPSQPVTGEDGGAVQVEAAVKVYLPDNGRGGTKQG